MKDIPTSHVDRDAHHKDDTDPDKRSTPEEEEQRMEHNGEFYDGEKDQDKSTAASTVDSGVHSECEFGELT